MGTRCALALLLAANLLRGAGVFDQAKRKAFQSPTDALAMLPSIERPADRAAIQRIAILRAASIDRPTAAREISKAISQPWLGDVLFADAVAVAKDIEGDAGRELVLASAKRHPEAALQNWTLFGSLPYAMEVLEAATALAPDEAVGILAGDSPYALELNDAFIRSDKPEMEILVEIAHDGNLSLGQRRRNAFADLPVRTLQDGAAYFHALADLRLKTESAQAALLDRGLEQAATEMCHTYQQAPLSTPEVNRLSSRDLYLLLAYARADDEDSYFARLFDLLAARGDLAKAVGAAHNLRLREFVDYALWFRRYETLMQAGSASAARMISPLFDGLSLENALTAADAIEVTPEPVRHILRGLLAKQQPHSTAEEAIKRSLAASLNRRVGQTRLAALAALNDTTNTVLERYFFYDDADGVESFANFRAQYLRDARWRWEDRGGWIRLTSISRAPAIEIVANVPVNALEPKAVLTEAERAKRQDDVTEYLGEREPAIIVHRGHAYHVEKTLRYLTRETRLVFLGSCRGLRELRAAIEASPQADIISTRAVGTARVNDPLLKLLNMAILGGGKIEWPKFWGTAAQRLARDADFAGYIPPHRNGAAAFLRLYDTDPAATFQK